MAKTPARRQPSRRWKELRKHVWTDLNNKVIFEHRKVQPDGGKTTWAYRHPVVGQKCKEHADARIIRGWCPRKPEAARVAMWRIVELLDAVASGGTIAWCCGEKDAEALRATGMYDAVTSAHQGESADVYLEQIEYFRDHGGSCDLFCDDDHTGWAYGLVRRTALVAVGVPESSIRLYLPAEGVNDVYDHLSDADSRARGFRWVTAGGLERRVATWEAKRDGGETSEEKLAALEGRLTECGCRRGTGQDWTCPHPGHDDEHPSFGVKIGDNGGLLLNCQTCMPKAGTPEHEEWLSAILEFLGLDRDAISPPGKKSQAKPERNDSGNAARLLRARGDYMYWVSLGPDRGEWRIWDSGAGRWFVDADGQVRRWGREVAVELRREAEKMPKFIDGDKRNPERVEALKFAALLGNDARLNSMLNCAKDLDAGRTVLAERFDADPTLLQAPNGTLVLGLGGVEFRPTQREDFLSRVTAVPYLPGAKSRELDGYLDLFLPKTDVRGFVQRVLGYSLLGGNSEGLMFFLLGGSNTGKSTLNNLIIETFGSYAAPMEMSALRGTWGAGPREDVAAIMGARFALASETDGGIELHADQIKRFTGNDMIGYRRIHGHQSAGKPQFSPIIATNSAPTVKGVDKAVHNRLCVIPFEVAVAEKDRTATDMLRSSEVLEAFFAWVVEGYRMYAVSGLGRELWPISVLRGTREFADELSEISMFVRDMCEFAPHYQEDSGAIVRSYLAWSGSDRSEEQARTWVGRELGQLGYAKKKVRNDAGRSVWVRVGIRLRSGDRLR